MLGNRPMSEWIARYTQSHQHPINRLCHTFGIPMIAASVPLFLAAIFVEGLWPIPLGLFVVGGSCSSSVITTRASRPSSSMIGASCWWASAGGSPRSGAAHSRQLVPLLFLIVLPACGAPARHGPRPCCALAPRRPPTLPADSRSPGRHGDDGPALCPGVRAAQRLHRSSGHRGLDPVGAGDRGAWHLAPGVRLPRWESRS